MSEPVRTAQTLAEIEAVWREGALGARHRGKEKLMHAYCYRSGEIGFGETIPKGCLSLIEGDEATMESVRTRARWKKDGSGDVLVPGLPEAGSEEEAYLAVKLFRRFLAGEKVSSRDPDRARLTRLQLETLSSRHA